MTNTPLFHNAKPFRLNRQDHPIAPVRYFAHPTKLKILPEVAYSILVMVRYFALTLMLQESRMLQIEGVKGEAVVGYCEPLTTEEMRHHRLSRRVNNRVSFSLITDVILSEHEQLGSCTLKPQPLSSFYAAHPVVYATLGLSLGSWYLL